MPILKEIIDNSEGNKLVSFLNNVFKENPKTNFDIATAFFNIQAFAMILEKITLEKKLANMGKLYQVINHKFI